MGQHEPPEPQNPRTGLTSARASAAGPLTDDGIAAAAFVAMPIAAFLLDELCTVFRHTRRAARLYPGVTEQPDATPQDRNFARLTHLSVLELRKTLRENVAAGHVILPMRDAHKWNTPKDIPFHLSLMRLSAGNRPVYMLAQDHLHGGAEALRKAHDIRKNLMSENSTLAAQVTELQRAVLSMETFAHAVSHDLRTPINAISGLLELFERKFGDELPNASLPYLGHLQRATAQMDDLTENLLKHAQSAGAPLKMQEVRLHETCADVLQTLPAALRANASRLDINGHDFAVMAEPTMLRILLSNLICNALKHGDAQRPLEVDIASARDGSTAKLSVIDTGAGFDPEQAHAIFMPFERLNKKTDGTGLGLATCAEICRRHNWQINAVSDGQNGAAFTVTFPEVLPVDDLETDVNKP